MTSSIGAQSWLTFVTFEVGNVLTAICDREPTVCYLIISVSTESLVNYDVGSARTVIGLGMPVEPEVCMI